MMYFVYADDDAELYGPFDTAEHANAVSNAFRDADDRDIRILQLVDWVAAVIGADIRPELKAALTSRDAAVAFMTVGNSPAQDRADAIVNALRLAKSGDRNA